MPTPDKLVQTVVSPVERDLDGVVQIGQRLIGAQLEAAPNHRRNIQRVDTKLENLATRSRLCHPPSLYIALLCRNFTAH